MLTFFDDPDGGFITETPIVAWRIDGDLATPITPDPDGLGGALYQGIAPPHGSVTVPGEGSFRNEDGFLEYMRELTRKRA